MSWSGSGTVTKLNGEVTLNISASPQSNNAEATHKSLMQIDAAKLALKTILHGDAYNDGEYGASISGHAHSDGDSKDSCAVSLYGK